MLAFGRDSDLIRGREQCPERDRPPSDFFRRNVVLSFQEDAIGIRLRDVIGVDNMMWGSDYPHSESTFPQSRKILAEILAGVPDDEQAKMVGGTTARRKNFEGGRWGGGGADGPCLKSKLSADQRVRTALQSAASCALGASTINSCLTPGAMCRATV